jgi:hypothetical protein
MIRRYLSERRRKRDLALAEQHAARMQERYQKAARSRSTGRMASAWEDLKKAREDALRLSVRRS